MASYGASRRYDGADWETIAHQLITVPERYALRTIIDHEPGQHVFILDEGTIVYWDGTKWVEPGAFILNFDQHVAYGAGEVVADSGQIYRAKADLQPSAALPSANEAAWEMLSPSASTHVYLYDPTANYDTGDIVWLNGHLYYADMVMNAPAPVPGPGAHSWVEVGAARSEHLFSSSTSRIPATTHADDWYLSPDNHDIGRILNNGGTLQRQSVLGEEIIRIWIAESSRFQGSVQTATGTAPGGIDISTLPTPSPQNQGYYWVAAETITVGAAPAGLAGQTINPGDWVVSTGNPRTGAGGWAVIPGSSLTKAVADSLYDPLHSITTSSVTGETPDNPGTTVMPQALKNGNIFVNTADGITWMAIDDPTRPGNTFWQEVGSGSATRPKVTTTLVPGGVPAGGAGAIIGATGTQPGAQPPAGATGTSTLGDTCSGATLDPATYPRDLTGGSQGVAPAYFPVVWSGDPAVVLSMADNGQSFIVVRPYIQPPAMGSGGIIEAGTPVSGTYEVVQATPAPWGVPESYPGYGRHVHVIWGQIGAFTGAAVTAIENANDYAAFLLEDSAGALPAGMVGLRSVGAYLELQTASGSIPLSSQRVAVSSHPTAQPGRIRVQGNPCDLAPGPVAGQQATAPTVVLTRPAEQDDVFINLADGKAWIYDGQHWVTIPTSSGATSVGAAAPLKDSGTRGRVGMSAFAAHEDHVHPAEIPPPGHENDVLTLKPNAQAGNALEPVWAAGGGAPIGSIVMWATLNPPMGWFLCDGRTFSQAQFPELYTALGNSNVTPDLRDMFVRGATQQNPPGTREDQSTAMPVNPFIVESGGTSSLDTSADGQHTHKVWTRSGQGIAWADGGDPAGVVRGGGRYSDVDMTDAQLPHKHTVNTLHTHRLSGGDRETRPVNVRMTYIIRAM